MKATGANIESISDEALAAATMDAMAGLKQKLILSFSCKDLPNMDKTSKSDCFIVLWYLKGKNLMKVKVGQTEMINDCLSPIFVQTIETDFFFEEQHKFLLEVYDADDGNNLNDLSKQDFIGSHQFTLHSVVT